MANQEQFLESIKRIEKLHGNLAVLSRLNTLLRDMNSDLSTAERLLASDSSISALVIKLSNSPIYRRGAPSSSLSMAIQQVGFNQILKMVGLAISKGVFLKDLKAYGITADQYWQSNYFAALFLESEAQRMGLNSDDAYLIGLLHSVGKVVINELLDQSSVEIYWDPSIPSEEWEEVMVGFRYDRAGAILLEKWGFHQRIHEKISNQNSPSAQESDPVLSMLNYCQKLDGANPPDKPLESWDFCLTHPYCEQNQFTRDQLIFSMSRLLTTIAGLKKVISKI